MENSNHEEVKALLEEILAQMEGQHRREQEIISRLQRLEAERTEMDPPQDGSHRKYPAPVMRMKDLEQMGFSKSWLMKVFRKGRGKVAWKTGTASNSPIYFDTEQLEKQRRAECVGGY